jgi:hypothetical protein
MNKLDKRILESGFPDVKSVTGKRYDKDDILKVLNFMKESPKVQLASIAEFSGISQGTLVSWRKKYGSYLGIRIKNYDSPDMDILSEISTRDDHLTGETEQKNALIKIPLSMIQELQKLHRSGSEARMTVNNTAFTVDEQYLYVGQI